MGLLTGPASLSRFNVVAFPAELDFEAARFMEIQPGSEVRERSGFVPVEPEAPYEIGAKRFAFRVRVDKLRADPTAVGERLKQLIRSEIELNGAEFVGPKKRKKLKELAEEELIVNSTPRSKIIECCIDGDILHVASTAKAYLGIVLELLRKIGLVAEAKAPWLDREDPDFESELVMVREPGQSVLGCRFLKALMGDPEVMIEGESGNVRLVTSEAKVTLTGAVLPELHRYVQQGAEVLAAKLVTAETAYRFDALNYKISSLRIETARHDHWIELLDERLEKINSAWELLDRKYVELASDFMG